MGTELGNGRNEGPASRREVHQWDPWLRKNIEREQIFRLSLLYCRLSFNDVINARTYIFCRSQLKWSLTIHCALLLVRVTHYYYYFLFQVSLQTIKRSTSAVSTWPFQRGKLHDLAYFVLLSIRMKQARSLRREESHHALLRIRKVCWLS